MTTHPGQPLENQLKPEAHAAGNALATARGHARGGSVDIRVAGVEANADIGDSEDGGWLANKKGNRRRHRARISSSTTMARVSPNPTLVAEECRRDQVAPTDAEHRRPEDHADVDEQSTGWRVIGPGMLQGVFRAARAYRCPPGISWSSVIRRSTVDMATGQVLQEIYPASEGISESSAGTRLGEPTDIVVDVEYYAQGIDPYVGFGSRRVRWADEDEDGAIDTGHCVTEELKGDTAAEGRCRR